MPTQTTQGAVSEYEHLNARSRLEYHEDSLSDGEDFLPLKPPKASHSSAIPAAKLDNINNSNIYRPHFQTDDFFSKRNLPLPSAWSSGVPVAPKPSINLTPLKSSENNASGFLREILEPHDTNKKAVPVPSAWGDDMIFKPTPSLFITPEKSASSQSSAVKDNFTQNSIETKENVKDQTDILKSRGKYSVRFDLPSFSSGDETNESHFFSSESPIVLKGQDISEDSCVESPQWKAFSPKKNYDPYAYSDESVLDDSLPVNTNSVSGTNETIEEDTNWERTTSALSESQIDEYQGSAKRNPKRKFLKKNTGSNSLTRKSISVNSQTSTTGNLAPALSNLKPTKKTKEVIKSGPQFLKSDISQYDKKPPKPFVVRESKNKHEEADYAYPFDVHPGDSEFEHAFARPEYNSTLRVRSEFDELANQEVDVEAALLDTLEKSEVKRTEVNEKASMYTNRLSDQFHNLVNLDTSMESLCDRIVRMRTSRVQTKRKAVLPAKKFSDHDKTPDLMEFFSPELQRESPDLSLPGVTPVTSYLRTAPQNVAFDLYRHNRLWTGINDF